MELIDNQHVQTQVFQKIKRIAFGDILKNNFEESEIIIAKNKGQGYSFAKIAEMIGSISPISHCGNLLIWTKST